MRAQEQWQYCTGISLGEGLTRVQFIQCDLAGSKAAKNAANELEQRIDRLDTLICNASTPSASLVCWLVLFLPDAFRPFLCPPYMHDRLAVNILRKPLACNPIINDRYKMLSRSYASNCVGHQVLATHLLPLMKRTIAQGKASKGRIAVASSSLHSLCRELDLNLLTSPTYPKPPSIDGVWRYARAKVGTILFTRELKRRLLQEEDSASSKVYVDASFPGNIVTDQWSVWDNLEDGAAAAIYLASSPKVAENGARGQYFIPVAKPYGTTPIASDMKLGRDLCDWIDAKSAEALSDGHDKTRTVGR